MRPNKPLISQLDALEIDLTEAKKHDPNTTDIALWFSSYNGSKAQSQTPPGRVYQGPYNISLVTHIRNNPDAVQIPLFYFHPNGSQYIVNYSDGFSMKPWQVTTAYCKPSQADSQCKFTIYQSRADRLAYLVEAQPVPGGVYNILLIDADNGQVIYDSSVIRPRPNVVIYDNISNAKQSKRLKMKSCIHSKPLMSP